MPITDTTLCLSEIPEAERQALRDGPASRAAHDAALAALPAFGQIELGGVSASPAPTGPLRIAAWNLERGLFPAESAALLRREGASLSLLTELDQGCHRTGQRHVTRLLAEALGQRYAYGVEFLELATMPAPVEFPDNPPGNALGFHGNGFLSALPFRDVRLIRLPAEADWFVSPRGGQQRIGARMALAAIFRHGEQEFVGCGVHLESDTDVAGRARQMAALLDELDDLAGGLPVVLGGDLNTPVGPGGQDDPGEALFGLARSRGYDWSGNLPQISTRPSLWSEGKPRQLDWLCARGCRLSAPRMTAALGPDGVALSDHELISATVEF